MDRIILILLVLGVVGYLFSKNSNQSPATSPSSVSSNALPNNASATSPVIATPGTQHTALTNMALESEAKAKQAAELQAKDPMAEYEKMNSEQ